MLIDEWGLLSRELPGCCQVGTPCLRISLMYVLGERNWFDLESLVEVTVYFYIGLRYLLVRVSTGSCWAHDPANVRVYSSAVLVLLRTPDPCGHCSVQRYLQQEPQNARWTSGSGQMSQWAGAHVGNQGSKPCSASALCRSVWCCAYRMCCSCACMPNCCTIVPVHV